MDTEWENDMESGVCMGFKLEAGTSSNIALSQSSLNHIVYCTLKPYPSFRLLQ